MGIFRGKGRGERGLDEIYSIHLFKQFFSAGRLLCWYVGSIEYFPCHDSVNMHTCAQGSLAARNRGKKSSVERGKPFDINRGVKKEIF